MRNYVITCDDCGLSEGINRAAVALLEWGLPVSPSIMTNFPAAEHAFALFAGYPGLRPGVHLSLTEGTPLGKSAARSPLVGRDGRFRGPSLLFCQGALVTRGFIDEGMAELDAQARLAWPAGAPPAHLTTHHHFHVIASLRDPVKDLARKLNVSWVRAHALASTVIPGNPLLRRLPHPSSAGRGPRPLDYVVPLIYWTGTPPAHLAQVIQRLAGTVEIVVHPDTEDDPTFPPGIGYSPRRRAAEVQYLARLLGLLPEIARPDRALVIDQAIALAQ